MNAIVGWADDSKAETLAAFVAEPNERVAYQVEPDKAGVELVTIHAAKGPEWDAVFLVGVAEGPGRSPTQRRRLPVRRNGACCTWRSPCLRPAHPVVGAFAGRRWARETQAQPPARRHLARGSGRGRAEEEGTRLHARPQPGLRRGGTAPRPSSLWRPKAWRPEVSCQAGVPPFAVFTDQTPRDIAQAMPKNTTQLRVIRGIGDVEAQRSVAPVLPSCAAKRSSSTKALSLGSKPVDAINNAAAGGFHAFDAYRPCHRKWSLPVRTRRLR